jgi:biopolymer transport protein ExbB/TolQ
MVLGTIIQAGGFFAEWLERIRLEKPPPEALPEIIRSGGHQGVVAHRVTRFITPLQQIIRTHGAGADVEIENLIQDHTIAIWRAMDRLRILVRLAPGLGLIGTLIPMGTGLAALGQGDMTKLSSDLVIAFTTTVVGLAIGMAAFFFYTVKRRWVEEDIKNIQVATEVLTVPKPEQVP